MTAMPLPVVCISHAEGAGGPDVGRLVAEELGYRYADEEIIAVAARERGLYPEAVLLAESRTAGRSIDVDFSRIEKTETLRELIREAIAETAGDAGVVIVAHAASYALAGRGDVLRVLVTASAETRSRRISEAEELDEKLAAKIVKESDKGRAAYIDRFYDVDHELPTHYDLVVNTDHLSRETAVRLIVTATGGGPGS